jgi:hypothetical protein
MDRDDEGALHQLGHVVRDALMAVLFEKRTHCRSQYDGDEQRQQQQVCAGKEGEGGARE